MVSRDRPPLRATGIREEPGAQPEATREDDAADTARNELHEAARLAEEYLGSAARLAEELLTKSGAGADVGGENKLAIASGVASELLATAREAAVELLATAQQVAVDRLTSAHRFEAMFQDHQAVMLLLDPSTATIVDANPAAAAFYGYPVEMLRSMPMARLNTMPAENLADLMVRVQSDGGGHFVFSHRLASGEIRRVDVHSSLIRDGRPLLFSIIVDIEDRVRAQEELARVSGYVRSLIEASLDPLVTISARGVITDVNAATVTVTGVPRQALIGSDFTRYFTDPDQARAGYREAFAAGSVTDYPLAIRNVDGSVTDVLYNASVYRDPDGDVAGVFAAARDITGRKAAEQALAAGRESLRAVLDTSRDTAIRIGLDGLVEYVNRRVVEISGIPLEQWIGKTFDEMGYPVELAQDWDAHRRRVFATGEPVTFEFEIDNADGHRWYETSVAPEFGPDGSVAHVIETSHDVTERKEAGLALEASKALLEQAQRIAHVGSWTLDNATNHVTWSEELFLMQGLDPAGPVPDYTEHSRLFTPASWQELSAALALTQETGVPYALDLEMVRPDGTHGWMLALGEAVRDKQGAIVGLAGAAMDITERRNSSDVLQVLATHDPLTGLANRAALLDEITRAMSASQRSGRSAAVLMLDLDRFKDVNDTLGHAAGDDLLVAAGARLEHIVRAGDLVARLGGDEFVVVMRDLDDPTEAVSAASRLVDAFRAPFRPAGMELYSTASIGVAIATGTGTGTTELGTTELAGAGDLLQEADTAMYAAKDAGRDRVAVFNEDLHDAATRRLTIEIDLRHALERDELAVWYQPEIDLTTGAVVAVEALLRWHHPDGTVWTADRFIDVAEETGLILDIGDWALNEASAQGAAWATARPDRPITVRVNASALQLAETGLLPAIDDAMAASGLDPALLCIEITETGLLRQTSTARNNLNGIHARGMGIALDDFGTGYASLTYLNQYPIDVIKIDRSFIADTTLPDHDHGLVAGIIALATVLDITVTAEGVEHPEQATHLREMGCPSAQGFHYSPALPPDQITPLLNHTYPCY